MSSPVHSLFDKLPAAEFIERYFHQLPIAVAGGAKQVVALGNLDVLAAIAAHPESTIARSRGGQWWPGDERPTYEDLTQSLQDGWTIFVRHAERFHPGLRELAADFGRGFAAPIDIHFFCTPARAEGFGWHYDVEDVFVLQTQGSKQYKLRKNTVNPWPLVETTPDNLCYEAERSLVMECVLNAGDWLYIPNGYWHATQAGELSVSLSVGVMSPTAMDVLEVLRPMLTQSLRWRQRLPLISELSGTDDRDQRQQLQSVLADLGKELQERLSGNEFVDEYLESRRANLAAQRAALGTEDTC